MKTPLKLEFQPLGYMKSCFKEKFGIPRQTGLVESATGTIQLRIDPFFKSAVKGLEQFSHLWVIFVFHEHDAKNWKPSIRPPRLGGSKKMGVLASRSPHRPNPIGLSVVKMESMDLDHPDGIQIHVSGVDILDGSPILDIKPYLPYADSRPEANSGWADEPIQKIKTDFSPEALESIRQRSPDRPEQLQRLIHEMLSLDPRPAFQKTRMPPESPEAQGRRFGFRLLDYDVKWEIRNHGFYVLLVEEYVHSTSGLGKKKKN